MFATLLQAQFTITENFKGSSVASNIVLGGSPNPATLTSGVVDPINNGWLRLTTDAANQRGYSYINTPFPSTLGVYIEFEYKTWRSRTDSYQGADGFSVFLFDATTSPFRIGQYGGSLGYANRSGADGLAGAYLGIGFDEYGNFPIASESKNGGAGGTAVIPNSIVLRGPESPISPLLPYRFLTHKKLGANANQDGTNSIDYNTVTSTRPTDDLFYRRVKVYIEPVGTTESPKYRIRVLWNTSPMGAETLHIDYETEDVIPPMLKMGFGASTGGGFNFHEIRNLLITTTGGVRVKKEVNKENMLPNENLTYSINVYNESGTPVSNLILNDILEDDQGNPINLADFDISNITFDNNGKAGSTATGFTSGIPKTTGFSNPFSSTMTLEANSMASFTVVGTVKNALAGEVLHNSVELDVTDLVGFIDTDLTNNFSTVSTTILNPNVDLKIEKGVNNNGNASSTGNTYTIIVSNVSSVSKPAGAEVIVTDVLPPGVTYVSSTATDWTTTVAGSTLTFRRSNVLDGQFAYPPITINVTPSGTGPWTNTANLTYVADTNPNNNSSSVVLRWLNYWRGTDDNDWAKTSNWTGNYVPTSGKDIEFATVANNGPTGGGNGQGAAINNLHLDQDRIIGNLINKSDKDLIITTENQLIINGEVNSDNTGGIVVNAATDKAAGTLKFRQPSNNTNVPATVQFYNQAYECDDCGFYRKQWQYFGVPVQSAAFPYGDVTGTETVNRWDETFNGDKWQPVAGALEAFNGYQMTNSSTVLPTGLYNFAGALNVGNANVALTNTLSVNYAGANLVSNSYTAAIPISVDAMQFPAGADESVYLFNTGTRDQWRKLNGTTINQDGYRQGQYLAVPMNLGGSLNLPDRIPSTHAFMILTTAGGNLTIDYSKLIKNTEVNRGDGTQIITRAPSTTKGSVVSRATDTSQQLPSLVIDVIGEQSADRVWMFQKEGTTHDFNNGWDGRKMLEEGIAQLYVNTSDDSKLQVTTVPELNNVQLGFIPNIDGKYTLEFSLSEKLEGTQIYLEDAITATSVPIIKGSTYQFTATKGQLVNRFSLTNSDKRKIPSIDDSLIKITASVEGKISIANESSKACSIFIYDTKGTLIKHLEVKGDNRKVLDGFKRGIYLIRLQNGEVIANRKLIVY